MNQTRKNLEELLDLATSSAERDRLAGLWSDLEALEVETPSLSLDVTALERQTSAPRQRRVRWLRAAAFFGLGVLSGALIVFMSLEDDEIGASFRTTAETAVLPRPTSFDRLAATHMIGARARSEPWAQATLLDRLVRDPAPAVQLAAADYLSPDRLTPGELEELTLAVVGSASPIVQLRILDLLSSRSEASVIQTLERLSRDEAAEAVVRRVATEALSAITERKTL